MAKKEENYQQFVVNLSKKVDVLQIITTTITFALALGFVALFISAVSIFHDAYTNKAATYIELTEEVREINQKIDKLGTPTP